MDLQIIRICLMEKEFTNTLMVVSTMVIGIVVVVMGRELTLTVMAMCTLASGRMAIRAVKVL